MKFIVRLSSEMAVKSPPVRRRWTKLLADNTRAIAKRLHSSARVRVEWDRLELSMLERLCEQEKANLDEKTREQLKSQLIDKLNNIPGIANFSLVSVVPFTRLADIYEKIHEQYGAQIKNKTFCVRVRRIGSHTFTSADVERYIGGELNQHFPSKGVRLKNPDITLRLEIHNDNLYCVEQTYQGLGGYPVGSQEGVLSLMSGGFDSTVASFQMIRRGLRTHFCFFNLGGNDHELAVKEIAYYLWRRYGSSHKVRFISVPFEPIAHAIVENVHPSLMGVVLKRMMLRAAEHVAAKAKVNAIVTGEAIAQVSSQTLPNLAAIDSAINTLVLRPLIASDKGDIIDIARKIGADTFCEKVPEYCGVISVKPSANVQLNKVLEAEAALPPNLIEAALETAQVRLIDKIMDEYTPERQKKIIQPIPINELPTGAIVVDIRHPAEAELSPLVLQNHVVESIPFYGLSDAAAQLKQSKLYYLYCAKGVMSQLHARYLHERGYTQIGVCRP